MQQLQTWHFPTRRELSSLFPPKTRRPARAPRLRPPPPVTRPPRRSMGYGQQELTWRAAVLITVKDTDAGGP